MKPSKKKTRTLRPSAVDVKYRSVCLHSIDSLDDAALYLLSQVRVVL